LFFSRSYLFFFFFFFFLDLHPNLALEAVIQELSVYCGFKQFGCGTIITLEQKPAHEKNCGYRPTKCPHAARGCKHEGTTERKEKSVWSKHEPPQMTPSIPFID